MFLYVLRRILYMIPVLIGVALLVFTLLTLTPGDPALLVLGDLASENDLQEFRDKEGLNDPFFVQFGRYLYKAVFHGDIGRSYITKRPVAQEILNALPYSLKLSSAAMVFAIILGIPFGVLSAVKRYTILDSVVMILAMIGISMPVFWLGLILILTFSVSLGWFPSSGLDTPSAIILPAIALGTLSMAVIARMTRSSMLEVINSDYVRSARAKGQRESIVIMKHALGNALIPIIAIIGIQFGNLLGGAVLTESVFSIPGVGRFMVEAIKMRDYPMVLGGVLFIAILFSVINLCVDLLYAYVDPRIRDQYI